MNPNFEYTPIKLYNNSKERNDIVSQANLHSILATIELVEKAYSNASITPEEYTEESSILLAQYQLALKAVNKKFDSIENYMKAYQLDFPLAKNRVDEGVPATSFISNKTSQGLVKQAILTGEKFITMMDALELNTRVVHQLYPPFSELIKQLSLFSSMPNAIQSDDILQPKEKLLEWLRLLNSLTANDLLDDDQMAQLKFDLEKAYEAFKNALPED